MTFRIQNVSTFTATVFQTSFHSYSVTVAISCLRIKEVLPVSSGALLAVIVTS